MKLIPKTIGNRKGDCAWSCSRWQTQPEKICKLQCTNQWHSLHTLNWFVLWNIWNREAQWPIGYGVGLRIKRSSVRIRPWPLRWVLGQGSLLPLSQGEAFRLASISYPAILVKYLLAKKKLQIFSGCVCHLEQLHAQSSFLFPIVFRINLIPFFDIGSVLAVLRFGMLSFTSWATVRLLFVAFVTAGCNVKSLPLPQCKPLSNGSVIHNGRQHKTLVFLPAIQRCPRQARTPCKFVTFRYLLLPCKRFTWASNLAFQRQRKKLKRHLNIAQSCAVVIHSLPVSATTFPTALCLYSYIAQGRLRKGTRYPSCRTVAKKEITSTWFLL